MEKSEDPVIIRIRAYLQTFIKVVRHTYQRGGKSGPTLLAVVQNSTGGLASAGLETLLHDLAQHE